MPPLHNDGIILINKPAGMTSFGVVARLRRVLSQAAGKKVKVGHTGTLDPFATGLMIIVTGSACRQAMHYTAHDKWYEAELVLGDTSTTADPEGEITHQSDDQPQREDIARVLKQFTGQILQQPPAFSAIKVNGKRAYQLARHGQVVELPKRPVHIYSLEIINYTYPSLTIRTHVSSGTYIRSLAVDIGAALGTGAYCRRLTRTKIAQFTLDEAHSLADFGIFS